VGFGEKLQREREMRGITLDEIAKATKIGTRSLRALEQEDFNKLPGGIFNKGFVRAYARYLGIDEEQAVADYMAAIEEPESAPVSIDNEQLKKIEANWKPLPKEVEGEQISSFRFPWTGVAILIVLIAAIVLAWRFGPGAIQRLKARHQSKEQQTEMAQQTTAAAYQAAPLTTDSATQPEQVPPPAATLPESTPAESTSASSSTESEKPAPGEFVIKVRVDQESWVSIKADGKSVQRGMLKAGQLQTFRAHEQVVLTAGNAAGVSVSFNGTPQPSLGEANKVRTVIFTPRGLQTQTAQ
jgi:cytoskeleton protein RodZ